MESDDEYTSHSLHDGSSAKSCICDECQLFYGPIPPIPLCTVDESDRSKALFLFDSHLVREDIKRSNPCQVHQTSFELRKIDYCQYNGSAQKCVILYFKNTGCSIKRQLIIDPSGRLRFGWWGGWDECRRN